MRMSCKIMLRLQVKPWCILSLINTEVTQLLFFCFVFFFLLIITVTNLKLHELTGDVL